MKKQCKVCLIEFIAKSNRSEFCSKECKNRNAFNKKQELLKKGVEGIDYVIDRWNGFVTPRIYGKWMKVMHPGKTTKDYLSEFPESPLCCERDRSSTTKNSGKHMKDPKYRKLVSDAMKGNKNPNHKSRVSKEVRQSRSPFSTKFSGYVDIEEAREFQKKHCHKGIGSNKLEYWLNKGYKKEEAELLLKERQTTFTLEKCIKKYGKEKGTLIFNERQEKWKRSLQENFEREGDGRSPSSKFANSIITELCNHLKIEIPKKEKWIKNKGNGNAYSYDFTYKKKIIEFNGDYWHCNPLIYEGDYFNKNKGLTAEEIWKYDNEKNNLAKSKGYQVLVIWESEWNENPEYVIKKCIKFLNG